MNKGNTAKKLSNDIFLIFILVFAWIFSGWLGVKQAQAAWGVPKIGTIVTVAAGVGNITLTEPTGVAQGDLMVATIAAKSNYAFTLPAGWALVATQQSSGDVDSTAGVASGIMAYIVRGATAPDLTFTRSASADVGHGRITAYTGGSGTPYDTGSASTTLASVTPTTPSITTAEAGELLVAMVACGDSYLTSAFDAATDPTTASGATDTTTAPTAGTWLERSDAGTTTGADTALATADAIRGTAGATGLLQATVATAAGHVLIVGAFKMAPPTTTLGDGTDPSSSTVAPGSTGNYLDQFTFVTNTGTDSVTALTVTTVNTTAVASMQIWNEAMTTQYFTTVSSPVGNNWNFSAGTPIPVTTSSASFRVVFTATSHASLAAGTYAVTGTVTSYTCTNAKTGTDTDSATITVDNSPPADATWGIITPGNTQIVLNWTNPVADFYKVLILRNTVSVTDAPTEGTEYVQDNTIGTSIVRYVGALETFTDTGLTNGTNYYYKIFAYDSYINYAAGVGTGPHTPILTLSISVSPLTWGVGTVDAATAQMSTSGNKIGVTNDGNVSETFTLQIATQDNWGEWTAASLKTGAGNNIYVLSGIFCATADSPIQTSFNETDSEDVLTTTQQTATATKFAYAGGSANAVAVSVSGQRSLWLRLDMPTAVSGTYPYDQHTITVRIGCQQ